MSPFVVSLIIFVCAVVLVLVTAYICFYQAFYTHRNKKQEEKEFDLPYGKAYEPYYDMMKNWMREARSLPFTEYSITSFDKLKLYAKYYECQKGAPIEIMFHGYRGTAERDLCGGISRCFALNRNVLLVDQRGAGKSEGNVITFGVKESLDCLEWVDFAIKTFGEDVKIILTGISMGAATVIMAAGNELPKNVIGVLADCGYTSAEDMIKKTINELRLPSNFLYPFVKLGGLLFGGFNIDKATPIESIKNCRVPVFFVHGEADCFVPCEMSRLNFNACNSRKKLFTVEGADHGLSFPKDPKGYLEKLHDFF